jgi:hypothetical protein
MTPPEVKIHVAADLPAERHAELQALFDEQFAGSSFQWAAPQFHVLTSIDGRLAASVRLYATLGWQIVEGPTTFEQPTGRATYPRRTMVLTFGSAPWPHGPIDLRGLPW